MRKYVDIVIVQKPVAIKFSCPYCCNDIDIDFDEFEKDTGYDLSNLINDATEFECPECKKILETKGVELD